jgi:hypothetical protein
MMRISSIRPCLRNAAARSLPPTQSKSSPGTRSGGPPRRRRSPQQGGNSANPSASASSKTPPSKNGTVEERAQNKDWASLSSLIATGHALFSFGSYLPYRRFTPNINRSGCSFAIWVHSDKINMAEITDSPTSLVKHLTDAFLNLIFESAVKTNA